MEKQSTRGGEHVDATLSHPRLNGTVHNLEADLAGARQELGAVKQKLETLYAALDNVHSGLLILDSDLRVAYSNPALHAMFKVFSARQIRRERPFYVDLLQAAANASAVSHDDYVASRLAWVVSADKTAIDINMADGATLRCQLATLPGGGRMLIYSDVTDIVRNAQEMEQLATIDCMTGIYNRRHFLVLADREWERARRYKRPLSFLMIDIDYFKSINDRFGHEIGDRAIVHVANLAGGCKRTSDVLARIGGDEFALLLPETGITEAEAVAERLRCEVTKCQLADVALPATICIGVAAADESMEGISDLMKIADQALFAAKRSGRNKSMCSIVPASPSNEEMELTRIVPLVP